VDSAEVVSGCGRLRIKRQEEEKKRKKKKKKKKKKKNGREEERQRESGTGQACCVQNTISSSSSSSSRAVTQVDTATDTERCLGLKERGGVQQQMCRQPGITSPAAHQSIC